MAIRIPTNDQSKIFLGSQEIGAVYVGANKVWPDAPTEQFKIVHTKQTGFTITIGCTAYGLVTINWGDGSSTLIAAGTSYYHDYATNGSHIVSITGDLTKINTFNCNGQLASEINLTADCSNIISFSCYSNNLTSLDVHYLTKMTVFYCYLNASLTTLIMPSSVSYSASERNYQIYSTAISSYTNPIGATNFSTFYAYSCPNLTSVDVSSMTRCSGNFYVHSCSNLTSINMQNITSCTVLYAHTNPKMTTLNVNSMTTCPRFYVYSTGLLSLNVKFSTCTHFRVYSNTSLTSLLVNNLSNCTNFLAYSNTSLTSLNLSSLTICPNFYVYGSGLTSLKTYFSTCTEFSAQLCPALAGIDASSITSCTNFYAYSNPNLTSININNLTNCVNCNIHYNTQLNPPSFVFTSINSIRLDGCLFTTSEVDGVLSNCLSLSDASCGLNLAGNNSSPSANGQLTKAALIAKGWSVSTN